MPALHWCYTVRYKPFGMKTHHAIDIAKVHTRQTDHGYTPLVRPLSFIVDGLYFVGIFFSSVFLMLPTSVLAMTSPVEFVVTMDATEDHTDIQISLLCSDITQQPLSCTGNVVAGGLDAASFDYVSNEDQGVFLRIKNIDMSAFQFQGRIAAFSSILHPGFAQMQGKWVSLAEGESDFLDAREVRQLREYIIPELLVCIQSKKENICVFQESSQLMIRSWILGRSVPLLGSDEHIKSKLTALDTFLEKGILVNTKSALYNGLSINMSIRDEGKVAPRFSIPKQWLSVGDTFNSSLSMR